MALRSAASTAARAGLRLNSASAARPLSTTAVLSDLDRAVSVETYNGVLDKFAQIRACAVLRTATSEACPKAMQAAIDGGFKIVEFTLTTPGCLQHLSDFRSKYDGDVMVGCGTILNTEDAENAVTNLLVALADASIVARPGAKEGVEGLRASACDHYVGRKTIRRILELPTVRAAFLPRCGDLRTSFR